MAEFEECSSLCQRWVHNSVPETVVNRKISMMGTTVSGLIAQVDVALPAEPEKITQLLDWLNQLPGVALGTGHLCALRYGSRCDRCPNRQPGQDF